MGLPFQTSKLFKRLKLSNFKPLTGLHDGDIMKWWGEAHFKLAPLFKTVKSPVSKVVNFKSNHSKHSSHLNCFRFPEPPALEIFE